MGQAPNESKRLLRRVYAALAEAERVMIGMDKMDETATLAAASSISERTRGIEGLLRSS